MRINKTAILLLLTVILVFLYLYYLFVGDEVLATKFRSVALPFATLHYILNSKHKSTYFTCFLVSFSLSEIMGLWIDSMNGDYLFFIGNSLYIIAYWFLVLEIWSMISKSINFKQLLKKYTLHIIVLLVSSVYLLTKLFNIVQPGSTNKELVVSTFYFITILSVLAVSFLNYIESDTKKALLIFWASLCLVFSEVIQISYFYLFVEYKAILHISYSILLILAFGLFIYQAFIPSIINKPIKKIS